MKNVDQDGFSLIELIVTLAVVAIVTSIALPAMNGYLSSSNRVAFSQALINDLAYARQEAITRKTPVSIVFNASGDWVVQFLNATNTAVSLKRFNNSTGATINVSAGGVGVTTVTFSGRGHAQSLYQFAVNYSNGATSSYNMMRSGRLN